MDALAFSMALLQALPGLVRAGGDLAALVQTHLATLNAMQAEGRDPTAAEWAALRGLINADTDALHKAANRPLA